MNDHLINRLEELRSERDAMAKRIYSPDNTSVSDEDHDAYIDILNEIRDVETEINHVRFGYGGI
jgi:uncharacterized coiled-coil DUF342 family protein